MGESHGRGRRCGEKILVFSNIFCEWNYQFVLKVIGSNMTRNFLLCFQLNQKLQFNSGSYLNSRRCCAKTFITSTTTSTYYVYNTYNSVNCFEELID